jgi:hypothetical protein
MIKDLSWHFCILWFSVFEYKETLCSNAFSSSLLQPDVCDRPLHSSHTSLPPTHPFTTTHCLKYQPSKFCHLFYDPVGEYMELHFFHVLKPPNFILPSTLGGEMKNVIDLLSQFHYPLLISDRVNKFSVRRLLEWLWWKFAFT